MTPDELNDLYHAIGKAVWHLQYVEEGLSYLYLYKAKFKKASSVNEDEAEKALQSVQKKTLGGLINEVIKKQVAPQDLAFRLERFNADRRWLIHKSLIEDGDSLYSQSGRGEVFARINNFIEDAIGLQKDIGKEIDEYCSSIGMKVSVYHTNAEQELIKLKGLE